MICNVLLQKSGKTALYTKQQLCDKRPILPGCEEGLAFSC
jgi:hypothetical protein